MADSQRKVTPNLIPDEQVDARKERKDTRSHAHRTLADLDECDKGIIRLLQEDGRISNAGIARSIGTSEPTVRKRIERLVGEQIIRVTAVINPAASGYSIDVLMGIRTQPGYLKKVGSQLAKFEQVLYLGYTTGRFDILANMLFRNDEEQFEFLSSSIALIEGIVTTESFYVMKAERVDFDWERSGKSRSNN